jgi:phage FluMu protein Com
MNYPLREKLEVYSEATSKWIRCTQCLRVLCRSSENWKDSCLRRLLPPTRAGPLLKELSGQYLLEQLYCPGCGALFNTDLVEEQKDAQEERTQQAEA